jgi:hypothetical protein
MAPLRRSGLTGFSLELSVLNLEPNPEFTRFWPTFYRSIFASRISQISPGRAQY